MAQSNFQLADYIAGFATAANSAQEIMSQGESPMAIASFRFKFNVTADFESKGEMHGDVSCRVTPVTMKDQVMLDYKEHMGIEIECTLVSTIAAL